MLRMDGFAYHHASSPEEAVALWRDLQEPVYIAGGTDLLPNLKHRILSPRNLIGISQAVPSGWQPDGEHLVIGAGTRLCELAQMNELAPLARAA
ncbi:MAG: FAD binding domain-containing protein, partial [Myxococcota bacterium]|nr:FAD binding domain-containing protein [Myxococcota bacterium]